VVFITIATLFQSIGKSEIILMANLNPTSRKGKPNKNTRELKDAILKSFEMVGGEVYLAEQARENPAAYMSLIGKVIPKEIKADVQGDLSITSITRTIVDAAGNKDS